MAMAKIKKGDKIVVLAGKDKGRIGEVSEWTALVGALLHAGGQGSHGDGVASYPAASACPARPWAI